MEGAYQNITAHMLVYIRRQSIIFEYQVPQLHNDNNLFHFTEFRFQDFRLLLYFFFFVIIRLHYSEHRHSRLFLTEIFINMQVWKGTEQKGAGIRWWLIVRDVMSAPFFSALLSVCFLSQCFSMEPNPDICHSETFPGRYDKDRNECGSCSSLLSLGVAYSL